MAATVLPGAPAAAFRYEGLDRAVAGRGPHAAQQLLQLEITAGSLAAAVPDTVEKNGG
jgi:hypothetical protein